MGHYTEYGARWSGWARVGLVAAGGVAAVATSWAVAPLWGAAPAALALVALAFGSWRAPKREVYYRDVFSGSRDDEIEPGGDLWLKSLGDLEGFLSGYRDALPALPPSEPERHVVPLPCACMRDSARARLEALRRFDFPHALAIHSIEPAGEAHGEVVVVRDRPRGPTVAALLNERGPLPLADAVDVALQVLALQAAHLEALRREPRALSRPSAVGGSTSTVPGAVGPEQIHLETVDGRPFVRAADLVLGEAEPRHEPLDPEHVPSPLLAFEHPARLFLSCTDVALMYEIAALLHEMLAPSAGPPSLLSRYSCELPPDVPAPIAGLLRRALGREGPLEERSLLAFARSLVRAARSAGLDVRTPVFRDLS